jgi:hypothetical protein
MPRAPRAKRTLQALSDYKYKSQLEEHLVSLSDPEVHEMIESHPNFRTKYFLDLLDEGMESRNLTDFLVAFYKKLGGIRKRRQYKLKMETDPEFKAREDSISERTRLREECRKESNRIARESMKRQQEMPRFNRDEQIVIENING